MVKIIPFKGLYYNQKKVNSQDVITPPYDVIDDELKKKLKKNHKYNFVNINNNDSSKKATQIYQEMLKKEILIRENKESIYIYNQIFEINNKKIQRTGIICLLDIQPFGNEVMPHEQTFKKYINQRFELMKNTKSDFGQLFMIYKDKEKIIDKITQETISKNYKDKKADIEFLDQNNCLHQIYKIQDKTIIKNIQKNLKNKSLLIADGHHRYSTALEYKKKFGKKYHMITLINEFNPGLNILPTNRIINFNINIEKIKENSEYEIIKIKTHEQIQEKLSPNSIIIVTKQNNKKNELEFIKIIPKNHHKYFLPVQNLHENLFSDILNIPKEKLSYPDIEFIKGNHLTLQKIKEPKYDKSTAFFILPPTLEQTFKIAKKNQTMPQKSTFFYPKLYSGLIINKFN